jgi:iron complex outermembrane receptor protein
VTGARFFLNGVDTTTTGLDVVAATGPTQDFGRSTSPWRQLQHDRTDQDPAPVEPRHPVSPNFLFDRGNIASFEQGTPERRSWARWTGPGRARRHGQGDLLRQRPGRQQQLDPGLLHRQGRTDRSGRPLQFPLGITAAFGVNNLTDAYPNSTPVAINGATGSVGYPSFSPYGFNGRFFYGRLSYSF